MNITIFYFLNSFALTLPWLDTLVRFIAVPFIYIFIGLVTLILVWKSKIFTGDCSIKSMWMKGKSVAVIVFSTGLSYVLANVLKTIIKTDRPFVALQDVHTLISETGYAFPSGHSATIAGFAFAVFFKNKKLGLICFLVMLLIGVSRVIAGVHFPIDIIGGYALGFIVAYFSKSL